MLLVLVRFQPYILKIPPYILDVMDTIYVSCHLLGREQLYETSYVPSFWRRVITHIWVFLNSSSWCIFLINKCRQLIWLALGDSLKFLYLYKIDGHPAYWNKKTKQENSVTFVSTADPEKEGDLCLVLATKLLIIVSICFLQVLLNSRKNRMHTK
jgi:hypothetical protein